MCALTTRGVGSSFTLGVLWEGGSLVAHRVPIPLKPIFVGAISNYVNYNKCGVLLRYKSKYEKVGVLPIQIV